MLDLDITEEDIKLLEEMMENCTKENKEYNDPKAMNKYIALSKACNLMREYIERNKEEN